ncbi:diacylglycerol/lipid kinase family protein [Microbacterium hydrocarbonoxydans]|uniref:diacylglycerol/lipid kinase family protein n=1 Tax=Microbacterium hydrocarbonoxydans TaxID=273678 RepID=UPI00203F790E|nr:diacylglycerol kinase family protein [Microbacterium hydrocarbonoxydans]MCM3778073.1 NAD(+)/NADH kinase [Microbacterium hydrocarbonoxydans]
MTKSSPARRQAALVYNPIKVAERDLRARVRELSKEAGWEHPAFYPTTIQDAGQRATAQAIERGVDVVLVAGGDGTVRAVAETIAGTGVPLAILPSGTGNLLARNLGLPLAGPDDMIRAALGDFRHPIDIGWARLTRENGDEEEHAYVVLAGIGLDADMIANTRPDLKRSVGWIAYVDGAARSLVTAEPFRAVFQIDDGRLHTTKVHSILFANCGTLPAGIALIPDASITDATLDLAVIQPTGVLGWLGVWRKIWWDNSVLRRFRAGRRVLDRRGKDASVHYFRGTIAEAAANRPTPIELDGDEFGSAVRITCRVDPGALLLALPAGHPVSSL